MLRNLFSILLLPFAMLFSESPEDDPNTADLILRLKSADKVDSVAIVRIVDKDLKRVGEKDSAASSKIVRVEYSKSGIRSVSKIILNSLIYPPDDILLCTDKIGYLVYYHKSTMDTILIDEGGKRILHKVDGKEEFSYFKGGIWGKLAPTSNRSSCNE